VSLVNLPSCNLIASFIFCSFFLLTLAKTVQPGTYWYHSHTRGQYPDGLRGPLIVETPDSPHKGKWDHDLTLTLSDWYHDQMPGLIAKFISYANPTGAEPVPNSALMSDTQNLKVAVEPGKTYFFRIINMGAFAAQYLWFEGHTMRVIEVDGVWTDEAEADMLYITAAQRYGVLVTMKNETSSNFAIVGSMDQVGRAKYRISALPRVFVSLFLFSFFPFTSSVKRRVLLTSEPSLK